MRSVKEQQTIKPYIIIIIGSNLKGALSVQAHCRHCNQHLVDDEVRLSLRLHLLTLGYELHKDRSTVNITTQPHSVSRHGREAAVPLQFHCSSTAAPLLLHSDSAPLSSPCQTQGRPLRPSSTCSCRSAPWSSVCWAPAPTCVWSSTHNLQENDNNRDTMKHNFSRRIKLWPHLTRKQWHKKTGKKKSLVTKS